MLFVCSAGHLSRPNEKQILVTTKRRRVHYTNIATNQQGLTVYSKATGYETVEERPYCLEHSRTVTAVEVGEVDRRFKYLSHDPRKFRGDAYS